MVSREAKILLEMNFDPLVVGRITNESENALWRYLSELEYVLNEAWDERKKQIPFIRDEAAIFRDSIPEAYETKRLLLLERLQSAKTEKEKIERLTHYKLFTGKIKSLPEEQVERARNYPLKDLLGVTKNIAKCPFHDDRTASLNIKNNFYHCHACNISGDVIDFIMKRDGMTFKEAITHLTC